MRSLALVGVLLGGCSQTVGSNIDAASDGMHVDPYTQTLPDGPCGVEGITGTLPGVTLAIHSASCVYKRGKPATFTVDVTTSGVPPITIPSSAGCGDCQGYSTDPLTFTSYNIYGKAPDGDEQRYCLCDVGCCPPDIEHQVQVEATTKTFTIDWSGREWGGPSDTGNEMGDFFLPGRYSVYVTFRGFDAGNVQAVLPIEIVL